MLDEIEKGHLVQQAVDAADANQVSVATDLEGTLIDAPQVDLNETKQKEE
jgi:hypothetical protein